MVQKDIFKRYMDICTYIVLMLTCICVYCFYFLDQHKRKIPKPQDPEGAWPTSMPWSWAAMRSFSLMDLCWVSVSWWDRDTFSQASGAPEGPPGSSVQPSEENNRKFQVARLQTQAQPSPAPSLWWPQGLCTVLAPRRTVPQDPPSGHSSSGFYVLKR